MPCPYTARKRKHFAMQRGSKVRTHRSSPFVVHSVAAGVLVALVIFLLCWLNMGTSMPYEFQDEVDFIGVTIVAIVLIQWAFNGIRALHPMHQAHRDRSELENQVHRMKIQKERMELLKDNLKLMEELELKLRPDQTEPVTPIRPGSGDGAPTESNRNRVVEQSET